MDTKDVSIQTLMEEGVYLLSLIWLVLEYYYKLTQFGFEGAGCVPRRTK